MKRVRIVEYYAGNIFSVVRAFEYLDCEVSLASRPEEISDADLLVLPGVGAFGDGMATLRERGLIEPMLQWAQSGRPFLGICLGMQLMLASSEEFGVHKGLGLIPGAVRRLPQESGLKIPNIGWHSLHPPESREAGEWQETVLGGVSPERDMYFVHSYAAYPENADHWLARTAYGGHWFCSVVADGNVIGCQFHPEKSGEAGLQVLRNFISLS